MRIGNVCKTEECYSYVNTTAMALVVIALGYSVLAIRYCEKRTLAEYVKGME